MDCCARAGVVAGLADSRVAKAWALQDLASLAGTSRACVAAYFGDVVGQPAIDDLAVWRLSMAQRQRVQGRHVKTTADELG